MTAPKSTRRNIWISDALWEKAKSAAKKADRTVSYMIRKAMEAAFNGKD